MGSKWMRVLRREMLGFSRPMYQHSRQLTSNAQQEEAFKSDLRNYIDDDKTKLYQWGVERPSVETSMSFYSSDFSELPYRFTFCKINNTVLLFRDIFEGGFTALSSYLHGHRMDHRTEVAVNALVKFVLSKGSHESSLKKVKALAQQDTEFTAVMAKHLLSQLLPKPDNYLLEYRSQEKATECPCGCGKMMQFGIASFGNKRFFYGYPDIMLFSNEDSAFYHPDIEHSSPCVVQNTKEDNKYNVTEENLSEKTVESEEVVVNEQDHASHYHFDNSTRMHLIKQAVAASFCHRKNILDKNKSGLNDGNLLHILKPCCGISPLEYEVAMYDSTNDVLLLTDSQRLFTDEESLSVPAIVNLWMVLNHSLFCRGLWQAAIEECRGSSRLGLTDEERREITQGSRCFFEIDGIECSGDESDFEATEIILSKGDGR